MAFETSEHPFLAINRLRNGNGLKNGSHNQGFFRDIERRFEKLDTWHLVALLAGGVLVVDHLIAPKGMSYVSKTWDKVSPGHHRALPPPPPPAVIPPPGVVAKGMYAGANRQAGANWGGMPYGGWAHANPGGPYQYAHGAQRGIMGSPGGVAYDWQY